MEITRQADYAVRAVLFLASTLKNGSRVPTSIIADEADIPLPFLTKVISRLSSSGILTTSRGMGGGVSLAKAASDISLLEVIEAVDGPIHLNRCLMRPGYCSRDETCAAHIVWTNIQSSLVEQMEGVNFANLALEQEKIAEAKDHK